MKKIFAAILIVLVPAIFFAQGQEMPSYYKVDTDFSESLYSIVKSAGLDADFDVGEDGIEQVSFCVIDLNSECITARSAADAECPGD